MTFALEYNSEQETFHFNAKRDDGEYTSTPNTNGFITICYGPFEDIKKLATEVEEEIGCNKVANIGVYSMVRDRVEEEKEGSIKMYPEGIAFGKIK